jgi:hypothetical protein
MDQNNMTVQDLWTQMQDYQSGLTGQLTTLQNSLSGNVITPGTDGLSQVAGGINRYGEARPGTVLMRDASGNLDPRFLQTMSPEYLALQQKAMATGDTESARLAREQQGIMNQASMDSLQRQGASALSGGMRNLAMRGGAGLGSRERLNRDISRGMMTGNQSINRDNRMANLAISQGDEQMKNQLLGQVGGVAQKIEEANVNRLQQDLQSQNMAAHSIYGEDMQALAADKSANAQAAAACFTADTRFKMIDGSFKPIKDIQLGEILHEGGKVYFTTKSLTTDLYVYNGQDSVSGTHAIKEDGKWIRVQDSEKAKKISGEWEVYNIGCENHIMMTDKNIYSDFFETDFYEDLTIEQSLKVLNNERVG